jgi:hypothetical protein
MIWFDHSIWFMLNNLDRFFDACYPSLAAKFGAFFTWISTAAIQAVRLQVTFTAYRKLMDMAAIELAANPLEKLLAKCGEAPGARQIERLFKPAAFSLESMPSPSPVANSKKRRFNMNVTPDNHYQSFRGQNGPQRHTAFGGGHGRYNKNFRPAQRANSWLMPVINQGNHQSSPSTPNRASPLVMEHTPPSGSTSSVTIRPWSPIRGRVLNWDDA